MTRRGAPVWGASFAAWVAGIALFWMSACEATSLDDVLQGKTCSPSGECASGYVCDPKSNLCVTHIDATGGAASSSVGSTSSVSSSSGGTCTSVTECPAPENHCETPICVGGLCGTTAVVMGAPSGLDMPHDCKTSLCDGTGHAITANDDTDPPAPAVCASSICDNGVPLARPEPAGTGCSANGGSLCDGQSHCVECLSEADCTGLPPTDECQQRVCTAAGACMQTFTPNHTLVAAQNQGDCQAQVCDGAGAIVSEPLVTDPPDDGNDCTTQTCNGDGTVHLMNIGPGIGCLAGVCDGVGHCTGCVAASNCGTDTFCATWSCVGTGICQHNFTSASTALPVGQQTSGDCQQLECNGTGGVVTVEADLDAPADEGLQCTDETCETGSPQHPPAPFNDTCNQGGIVCDGAGSCVECNSPGQCTNQGGICAHATCSSHACGLMDTMSGTPAPVGSQTPGDCQLLVCDGAGGSTHQDDNTDLPLDGDDCTFDLCTTGTPSNPDVPAGAPCGTDGFCDGSGMCSAKKPNGNPCSLAAECESGHCPADDGVCCDDACNGTCEGCSAARTGGTTGQCDPIPMGQDPDAECTVAGQSCNGLGACAFLCGQSPTAPGGTCPSECTGGCGTGMCFIDCNGAAACGGATIACPAGWACEVQCDDLGACDGATITCPDVYSCSIVCSSGACGTTAITCSTGICALQCAGAGSCLGASVACGQNSCDASCTGGSEQPGLACGGSCNCSSCP